MTSADQHGVYLTHEDMSRLKAHITWLEGDHEQCNPFLAETLRALLAERDRLREALHSVAYRSGADDDLRWCQRIAREALKGDQT